jgi:hypothetical protein
MLTFTLCLYLLSLYVLLEFATSFPYQHQQCNEQASIHFTAPYPEYFQNCWNRLEIIEIAQNLNFTTGAEIGVQKGHFAEAVLGHWPNAKKYHLIDIWGYQEEKIGSIYLDTANVNKYHQDENYEETKNRMAPFKDVPHLIRNYSVLAAPLLADASLDFVYIDARHDYCGVKEDLEAWWPKLRLGGIMAGHDFYSALEASRTSKGAQHWEVCGDGTINDGAVKGAVTEFACKHDLKIYASKDKPPSFYYSRKTKENN